MQTRNSTNLSSERLELARKCLRLIRDIAKRGASSCNADDVGYALQELSQVLLERTGMEDRLFEPIPADQIGNLRTLHRTRVRGLCFPGSMCGSQMPVSIGSVRA
jgi:hypothetical protein